jgi:glycerate-2-kinase
VRDAVSRGALDHFSKGRLSVVSAGKAGWLMASGLDNARSSGLLSNETTGIISGPRVGSSLLPEGFEWFDASHPSPDATSEAAGRKALELARQSESSGGLLVLLSGGASALMAVPAEGLSLADKMLTARVLMNAGAPIADLNCVRKHLSAIKGGRLAAAARRTVTLAISDVHGPIADDPAVIGSGPTVGDPTTSADALEIIQRAGVRDVISRAALEHLERGDDESPKPGDPRLQDCHYEVVGNRELAVAGAARAAERLGYTVHVFPDATKGEAREAGAAFASRALRLDSRRRLCVVASGETTVHVRGRGRGGRNQEFALGALPVIDGAPRGTVVVLASAGTDGIDGPTDAAGAIVDHTTTERAARHGVSADAALAVNGAYDFFRSVGDLIIWGPTGTNVGDLHVVLVQR